MSLPAYDNVPPTMPTMTRPVRIATAGVALLAVTAVGAIIVGTPPWAAAAGGAPHFVEQAAVAGIEHRYDGEL